MLFTRALSIRTPGRGQTMSFESFWNQVLKLGSPAEPILHSKVPSTCKKQ